MMTKPPPILVLVAFLMQCSICAAFSPPRASIISIGSANTKTNFITPVTTVKANNDANEIASTSAPQRKTVTEISPLKASMLTKSWQSLLDEVDQKVGVVPELGSTSVGVQRFGPELERRTLCKREFAFFQASTFGLALADKNENEKIKKVLRNKVPGLEGRGMGCKVFACLTSPATMSLVECGSNEGGDIYWNVIALIVNPTERSLPIIIDCERAALDEVRALAGEAEAVVRINAALMNSLAGSHTDLAIVVPDTDTDTDAVVESDRQSGEELQWLLSVTE